MLPFAMGLLSELFMALLFGSQEWRGPAAGFKFLWFPRPPDEAYGCSTRLLIFEVVGRPAVGQRGDSLGSSPRKG